MNNYNNNPYNDTTYYYCICTFICTDLRITYVCMYVCMYIYIYIYICIHVYIYIYIYQINDEDHVQVLRGVARAAEQTDVLVEPNCLYQHITT